MSTATEISRLQTARNTIRNKMVALGLGTSTDLLDDLATEISGIENQGAVTATVQEGDTYTIPEGYHNGSGTVSGVSGGGNYTLQSKSVTPTKSSQSVTADNGYYGLSGVTVAAIPAKYGDTTGDDAVAANLLAGKKAHTIVNGTATQITGSMTNNGAISGTIDGLTTTSYTVPAGYTSGGTVSLTNDIETALAAI